MDNVGVSPLKKDGQTYSDSKTQACILNDQFSSVFTTEPVNPLHRLRPSPCPAIPDINTTEEKNAANYKPVSLIINRMQHSGESDCTAARRTYQDELSGLSTTIWLRYWENVFIIIYSAGEETSHTYSYVQSHIKDTRWRIKT